MVSFTMGSTKPRSQVHRTGLWLPEEKGGNRVRKIRQANQNIQPRNVVGRRNRSDSLALQAADPSLISKYYIYFPEPGMSAEHHLGVVPQTQQNVMVLYGNYCNKVF